ncbi:unnamed protein product [Rhizophagus irregularis]|nr:unnamed protein product [Rhizophagus irregularis]
MSDFRRACIIHQPQFFKNDVYKNIKTRNDKLKTKYPPTSVNNKRFHANLLFNQWNKNEKKTIISRRLEISYEQTIYARVDNGTRRTLNKHIKEHNPQNRRRHRLITSQRFRFLYTASQSINKPIKHLQYTHGWDLSKYKFRTPLSKYSLPKDPRDDVIYHGTSFNRISRRIAAKEVLTRNTFRFDEMMKESIAHYYEYDDMNNKNYYHNKMVKLAYNSSGRRERYDLYMKNFSYLPIGALNDTSDDTIELEKRPKKCRSPYLIDHCFLANNSDRTKRLRVSPDFLNDSTGVATTNLDELIY